MIIAINSDLPTFKSVRFHGGLNVILADRSPDSGDRNTRNSAGKTSLIEIIHFLFGSKAEKDSLLRHSQLAPYMFRGEFLVGGERVEIARTGSEAGKIFIEKSSAERIGLVVRTDGKTKQTYIANERWKEFLGHKMFGLPLQLRGTAFDESFTPGFRPLFGYFARRDNSDAFNTPEKIAGSQSRWDWQVNLSYLLGLDWRIPFDLQRVRERERSLEELKKAAKGGTFGALIGTVAELRPLVAVAEARAKELRDELSQFKVMDSYRELSDRAARCKTEMQAIERRAVSLKETLNHLSEALSKEQPPQRHDLLRVYEAVGIELPETARRRFDAVERFHQSVIENRRVHLQEEIISTEAAVASGDTRRAEFDAERSEVLLSLEGSGALEDFVALQKRLADLDAEAASLRERFKAALALEGETTQLHIDRANIKRRLQGDHQKQVNRLNDASIIIAKAIKDLYEDRTGGYVVEATDNGPEFKISIQGDRGGGISHMEIFCFDLALFRLTLQDKRGPGFLVHDSHLFDGVDARQIARALSLGATAADNHNAQYIVTMNSDIFDSLPLAPDLDRKKIIASPRLSDTEDTGGLFGFQFD